ncbi:uncharacterized protein [Miscanthus floridulus]
MAAAAAAAAAVPPGYFVGHPLHYQDQQPQAEPPAAAAEAAIDDQNAVKAQVPGYYKGRVHSRPSDGTEHNNNADAAVRPNREPGFLAKL